MKNKKDTNIKKKKIQKQKNFKFYQVLQLFKLRNWKQPMFTKEKKEKNNRIRSITVKIKLLDIASIIYTQYGSFKNFN